MPNPPAQSQLTALSARIEAVALDPDAIRAQRFFRVAKPLFAITRWRAHVRYEHLQALVAVMQHATAPHHASVARAAFAKAVTELEANVETVERVAILRHRPPVGHAAWLRRAWDLLSVAESAVLSLATGAPNVDALCLVRRADEARLLPPLTLQHSEAAAEKAHAKAASPKSALYKPALGAADSRESSGDMLAEVDIAESLPESAADARVVELELAAIDRLLDAARAERSLLGRQRRLLVAARQRLLDANAALPLDPSGTRARQDYVARGISRIDRLEKIGLAPDVALVHQARLALTRGEPAIAYAALAAIDCAALAEGDARVARLASTALDALYGDGDREGEAARLASLHLSAADLLGADVTADVRSTLARARREASERFAAAPTKADAAAAVRLGASCSESAENELFRASAFVDGCFEVGGALSPIRVTEETRVLRQVRHPAPALMLVPARDADDIPDAIVSDPRTIILDLAAGRLLARRFVRDEPRKTTRVVLKSEVRVYVLDASTSMHGPRARVRDAIVVSELATMISRLRSPGAMRCTLFYRYFDVELGPAYRVDGVSAARNAIRDVVGKARGGGTDIEKALLASIAQVETARELDPDLARAQIVLVTDGEAPVDEAAVVAAKDAIKGVPVGVSVIALGQENAALRELVAHQRKKGEAAFYHFLDDAQLEAIASGALAEGLALHLPDREPRNPAVIARELEAELGSLVEELVSIEHAHDVAVLEGLDREIEARRESGITDDESGHEGERARLLAQSRDRVALDARFSRWFPEPPDEIAPASSSLPDGSDREAALAVVCALSSVAEVVELVSGTPLARRADAIELVERLLPDARLTPAAYRTVLRDYPHVVAPALRAIHEACRRA